VRAVLPIAVAMLPVNAAVYVFDGIITGASDFKFMAGVCGFSGAGQACSGAGQAQGVGLLVAGVCYRTGACAKQAHGFRVTVLALPQCSFPASNHRSCVHPLTHAALLFSPARCCRRHGAGSGHCSWPSAGCGAS